MGSIVNSLIGGTNGATASVPNITKDPNLLANINQAQQGVQANVGNQNAFAQALQTQMNGGGPNLAGAQLANATGQNVANQAALMASQRGTGSNAGLIARQAAQQGSQIQQNTAGQAAALRAQQQLSAQGELGNVYGQIGQEQGQNLSSNQSALGAQNNAVVGATTATNQTNAQIAGQNATSNQQAISGIGQAAAGTGSFGKAEGGEIMEADGGLMGSALAPEKLSYSAPLPNSHKSVSSIYHPHMDSSTKDMVGPDTNSSASTMMAAHGGKVKALVSPGENILTPKNVKEVADGKADPMTASQKVPGKPVVPGAVNSYDNDIVPAKLPVGSVVLPRSVTQSKHPEKNASEFVMAIINKKKAKK